MTFRSKPALDENPVMCTDPSKQRHVEAALRESERCLGLAQAMAHVGHWTLDHATGQVQWSEELFRIHGLEASGGVPTWNEFQKAIHPEDRIVATANYELHLKDPASNPQISYRIVRGDGSIRALRCIRTTEFDSVGMPVRTFGIDQDITDLVQAEEALRRSEERFRQISEAADEWIWEVDSEGLYTYASPVVERLLGFRPEELEGKVHFYDLCPPEDRDLLRSVSLKVMGEGVEFQDVPNLATHKDGRLIMLETTGLPILDADGRLLGYRGVDRDVTEKHQTEAALRESQTRFRGLFEHTPTAILEEDFSLVKLRLDELHRLGITDLRAHMQAHPGDLRDLAARVKIIQGNSAAHRLVGASTTGDMSLELPKYFTEESLAVFREEMVALFDGATRFESEIPVIDLAGRRMILRMNLSVMPGYEACLTRVLLSLIDLTAERKAEAHRRELEAQLQHAQKMESLGSLAGGVAHDINNVLGAILGLASAHVASQPIGSPLHQALGTICKATERGGKMVKSLLSFARQAPAEEHELDLNSILRDQVTLLERTTLAKVGLHLELQPDLQPIRGDASALTHSFMNLCVNSVDAMADEGTLTFRTRNVDPDWVEVAIEDTGTGMPKEVLEKAMDPFFTTKEVGKGTGLGLSLVYSTVKAHGGQLVIHSELGQGTRVVMRFPICSRKAPNSGPERSEETASLDGALRVLLVDDDELIQSAMQVLLESLGHRVTTALSGEEALALAEAGFVPDLVILDINMPGLGGGSTLPRLRALQPAVPVLLSTGRVDQTALTLAALHPGVALLPKPFGVREFQQKLLAIGLS